MPHSLTLAILAVDEEIGLKSTYKSNKKILVQLGIDHEIFIVNDGSIDQTGKIADEIQEQDSSVKVFHNVRTMGMGFGYKQGLKHSTKGYYMYTGAYSPIKEESIIRILECLGKTDLIIAYIENMADRRSSRVLWSYRFTYFMRWVTGLDLKYFNGLSTCRTKYLRSIKIRSNGYTFSAEGVFKLIKFEKCDFQEVGILVNKRKRESLRIFKLSNYINVVKFLLLLWYDNCTFKASTRR
jgi:glycosyltransferase involved in cell wall biosynthesis